jgi:hypothetical protein
MATLRALPRSLWDLQFRGCASERTAALGALVNTRCSSQRTWPLCHAMGDETLDSVLDEWIAALKQLAIDVQRTAAAIRALPLKTQSYCNSDDFADRQQKGEGQAADRHDASPARVHGEDCGILTDVRGILREMQSPPGGSAPSSGCLAKRPLLPRIDVPPAAQPPLKLAAAAGTVLHHDGGPLELPSCVERQFNFRDLQSAAEGLALLQDTGRRPGGDPDEFR